MQDTQQPSPLPRVTCPDCKIEMEVILDVPFRIGGTGGGWKLVFGEWAELGEQMLKFNLYVCHRYGKTQFYADKETRKALQMDPRLATLCLLILLGTPSASEFLAPLGPTEKSWTKSFVPPANNNVAFGGVFYNQRTQVVGSVKVRSCCGYSTNDIKFSIGLDYADMMH